jgi:hypothetical protein
VEKPRETLLDVGAFIGHDLDYDHILANAVGSVAKPNTSFPGSAGKFTGRWRDSLAPRDAASMEAMLAPMLLELGYRLELQEDRGSAAPRLRALPYRVKFDVRQLLKSWPLLGRRFADLSLFMPHADRAPVAR